MEFLTSEPHVLIAIIGGALLVFWPQLSSLFSSSLPEAEKANQERLHHVSKLVELSEPIDDKELKRELERLPSKLIVFPPENDKKET